MFDHVTIRVTDREALRRFYETVLGEPTHRGDTFDEWNDFSLAQDGAPVTRNLHVAFAARSRKEVDAFWRRGVDAGHRSDGEPGPRPQYSPDYYGGFLLDPDGNSVEAVHGSRRTEGGPPIDHLWIRVGDLVAAARFWETVAPVLDLNVEHDLVNGFHVHARNRSFALLQWPKSPQYSSSSKMPPWRRSSPSCRVRSACRSRQT